MTPKQRFALSLIEGWEKGQIEAVGGRYSHRLPTRPEPKAVQQMRQQVKQLERRISLHEDRERAIVERHKAEIRKKAEARRKEVYFGNPAKAIKGL